MLLGIIIALLILFILYLLLAPIRLIINTDKNQYFVEQKGLLKANLEADEKEVFKIRLKVLFFNFNFYPLKKKTSSPSKKKLIKPTAKRSKRSVKFKKVVRIIKTFKIKRFYLNLDTGDCISNAKLYPAFALLNYFNMNCHVNFIGRNSLVLAIENRPIRIIKSFINY